MNGEVPPEILQAANDMRRGPKNSRRLLEIDARASAAMDRGEALNTRQAAKLFLAEYGNEGFDPEHKNNRLADLSKRIKKYRASQGK